VDLIARAQQAPDNSASLLSDLDTLERSLLNVKELLATTQKYVDDVVVFGLKCFLFFFVQYAFDSTVYFSFLLAEGYHHRRYHHWPPAPRCRCLSP